MATYTYSGDPSASIVDEVRFTIGDTDDTAWYLSDEEITYLYSKTPDILMASSNAVSSILAKVARYCEETVGDVVVKWQQVYANFEKLKRDIDSTKSLESTGVYCGGISMMDKLEVDSNSDRVDPAFTRSFGTTHDTDSAGGIFSRTY